ncbi:conserved hypothetical protein [Histoplasma capsulatum var. duboisii H88]|uniref:Rhodopsin domain-containing protein n=1 Tax=Ajellomyces capsulatus (strain H88) TaxID=544711 RepID=F0UQ39_AJEC8|nr:conserved hypothetical protein [Histoplasma capsulatum var. duboisii H88]
MAISGNLPPGISEPLAVDTNKDHGGFIAIVTALLLGFALVSLGIRAYVQHSRHVVKKDDYVLLTAAATYAADILYIVTHCISKSSAALFYLWISPSRSHVFVAWGLVGVSVIWAVVSMILLSSVCGFPRPWLDASSHCAAMFPRWQIITAFDIITEASLAAVSLFLVAGIQMPVIGKIVVVSAFSSRLLVALPASFHLHYIKKMIESSDYTLVGSSVTAYLQLELSYGIMANTIPCLKPFMAAYEETGRPSYRSRIHSRNGSHSNSGNSKDSRSRRFSRDTFTLSTIASTKSKRPWIRNSISTTMASDNVLQPPPPLLRQKFPPRDKQPQSSGRGEMRRDTTARIGSPGREGSNLENYSGRRIIIKKDVIWNVESSKFANQEEPAGATIRTNVL